MQFNQLTDHIYTIDGFYTARECDELIAKSESLGYAPAAIQTERGQRVITTVRNNNRVLYTDEAFAQLLWEQVKPFAPAKTGNSYAIGLNELFRFYRYEPGQQFRRHRDQSYFRNSVEASYYTFMIYLNDNFEGGETKFNKLSIAPKQGMALIFLHDLEHEGCPVTAGMKYVLRTDIMYRLETKH